MLDSASVVGLLGVNELFTNFGYLNNDLLNPIPPYDPASLILSDDDDNEVYLTTIFLEPGIEYQYKFVNGNSWSGVEQVERSLITSPVKGLNLNEVCYNLYEDCF